MFSFSSILEKGKNKSSDLANSTISNHQCGVRWTVFPLRTELYLLWKNVICFVEPCWYMLTLHLVYILTMYDQKLIHFLIYRLQTWYAGLNGPWVGQHVQVLLIYYSIYIFASIRLNDSQVTKIIAVIIHYAWILFKNQSLVGKTLFIHLCKFYYGEVVIHHYCRRRSKTQNT